MLPSALRPRTRRSADQRAGWSLVGPSVILIGGFGLLPVLWSVLLSFQHDDLQTPATWAGLSNYKQLAHDPFFF